MKFTAMAFACLMGWASAQTQVKGILTLGTFNKYIGAGELAKDVWGYTLPNGQEFALQSFTHGLSVLNVTHPANITEVAFIPAPRTNWKTVKVYRHYAYLGTDNGGNGLQIIDLSGLPNSVKPLPSYTGTSDPQVRFNSTHNIWIDTARALLYATGTNGQNWRILSLADPEKPVQIYYTTGESHDFFTRSDRMYFSNGRTNQTRIFNVANAAQPQLLGVIQHPGGATYVHNSATTKDGNYLLTTEEVGGKTLKIWDIRNPASPTLADEYLSGTPSQSIAHNVYVKGDTAYISHYGQGFRVLDITNRNDLREIAYYRPQYTPPSGGSLLFGSFGAYVHLPSGNILSSDATLGLFVQRLAGPTPIAASSAPRPRFFSGRSGQVRFFLEDGGPFTWEILALTGQSLRRVPDHGLAGWNTRPLDRDLPPGSYQIRVGP
jgi:choice-of-anchor B domain-containing protein